MPDMSQVNDNRNFVFDPQISGTGENQFWKFLTGTPTVASNKLRMNAAEIVSFSAFRHGNFSFLVNCPDDPETGDNRSWGLKSPALGDKGRIEFQVVDDVFSVVVMDNDGEEAFLREIEWNDAAWNGEEIEFEIRWARGGIVFLIDGDIVARYGTGRDANPTIPDIGLPLHINNAEADNVDIGAVIVKNTGSLT